MIRMLAERGRGLFGRCVECFVMATARAVSSVFPCSSENCLEQACKYLSGVMHLAKIR